jgi:hypothetical protein
VAAGKLVGEGAMPSRATHLRVVERRPAPPRGDRDDLALCAFLFAASALTIAAGLAQPAHAGPGAAGLGTAGALLAGRECCSQLLARMRR